MSDLTEFQPFPKMARLSRECIITEKIDGTNAQVVVLDDCETVLAASRTRLIVPGDDNFGFAKWVGENTEELRKLGPGRHFGEWYGQGIQRRYGLSERRFALFNVTRWADPDSRPACCEVVPLLWRGLFRTDAVEGCIEALRKNGSAAVPGWSTPEGVVVFHIAAGIGFKKTLEKDEAPKGQP